MIIKISNKIEEEKNNKKLITIRIRKVCKYGEF